MRQFKNTFSILLFFLFPYFLSGIAAQSSILFPIKENGKYGFINQKGQVIIAPRLLAITRFSEGLVAIREKGHYGYIDASGEYVIKPIYDYGEPFQEGKVVVYKNGQPYFINKFGKLLFGGGYAQLFAFKEGKAKVKTQTEKYGVVDTAGILLVDTLFSELKLLENGLAIVEGAYDKDEIGIIDEQGNFKVPYGRFHSIRYIGANRYKVAGEDPKNGEDIYGVINNSGQLLFSFEEKGYWLINRFYNGMAAVTIDSYTADNKKISYGGYINPNGKVVIQDTLFPKYKLLPFFGDYTVVTKNSKEFIIDKVGNKIGEGLYDYLEYGKYGIPLSEAGLFVVSKGGYTAIIDDYGDYILKPSKDIDIALLKEDYFFFSKGSKFGIAEIEGAIILPAILDDFDRSGFRYGLLACQMNGRMTYLNEDGITVWQERKTIDKGNKTTIPSIDYKMESNYRAKPMLSNDRYGGTDNFKKYRPKFLEDEFNVNKNELVIKFMDELRPMARDNSNHKRVLVINNSDIEQAFPVQDSHLYMRLQAKDTNGTWRDIEYISPVFCLNSYYKITLPAKKYWEFTLPSFEGVLKTNLRVALDYYTYSSLSYEEELKTIYSDTFEGSINPGQLWRETSNTSFKIFHPY